MKPTTNTTVVASNLLQSIDDYMVADGIPLEYHSTYMTGYLRNVIDDLLQQMPPSIRRNAIDRLQAHIVSLNGRSSIANAHNLTKQHHQEAQDIVNAKSMLGL